METVKELLTNNFLHAWALISIVISGIVAYFLDYAIERGKNKRRNQRETLETILIPFCTCLENIITEIHTIYESPTELYINDNFTKWLNGFKEPFKYLGLTKQIFLSEAIRSKLQEYKNLVEVLEKELQREATNCAIRYKHYLSKILENFPNIKFPMLITYATDKLFKTKIKIAILTRDSISLLENFVCINFVINDEFENYKSVDIYLNEDIRELWGAVDCGVIDITDIEDYDAQTACRLLDFINENVLDEKEFLDEIVGGTYSAKYLSEIITVLNDIVEKLLQDINKITN